MPFYSLYKPGNHPPPPSILHHADRRKMVSNSKSQVEQKPQNQLQIWSPTFGQQDIQSNNTAVQGATTSSWNEAQMKLQFFFFPTYEWVWARFGGTIRIPNFSPCILGVSVYILYPQACHLISRWSVPFLRLDFKLSTMGDTGSPPALRVQNTVSSPRFLSPLKHIQT